MGGGKKIVRIPVQGRDGDLWAKLSKKLLDAIESMLDSVADQKTGNTFREEAQAFTSLFLEHGKEKLKKASIENQEILANVGAKYAEKQKALAEAREINANAEAKEFETKMKKLRTILGLYKVILVRNTNEQSLVILKEIETFQEAINQLEQ